MLAGTPGVELRCPPKLVEVTDAGVAVDLRIRSGSQKNQSAQDQSQCRYRG